jgi:GNAT superfamily N-acetyltransferase
MITNTLVENPDELTGLTYADGLPVHDANTIARDSPDAQWGVVDSQEQIIGRCSAWWRNAAPYDGHRVGVIGHYAARDRRAARRLLAQACHELYRRGCTMAVGPMDGTTWRNYRLVTQLGSRPSFFLEPTNPQDWPDHFLKNGFDILAEYFSALNSNLTREGRWTRCIEQHMSKLQVDLRPLDTQQFDQDLRKIYTIATSSFENHLLYTQITAEEFIGLYRPLRSLVDDCFIIIAERYGEPIGFIFAVPDLCQAQRGHKVDTLIVKTLAVQPGHIYSGLGYLLLEYVRMKASESGYTQLIHALVHDDGHLRRMTDKFARPIRRYALFCKDLRR